MIDRVTAWRVLRAALVGLLALAAPGSAAAQQSSYENGVTYGVGRLRVFAAAGPQVCTAECQRDPRCRGWTFVRAQYDSAGRSLCHLHARIYERSASACCVSGTIYNRDGAHPPYPGPGHGPGPGPYPPAQRWQSTLFDGVTYGVGTYRYFNIPGQDSGYCRDACGNDPRCNAWTYQRVEYNSSAGVPVCHLHRSVYRRDASPCCVSGTIRRW